VELQDVTATPISSHDAAKESNLPSRGLPGPASFEDWMGHQARAAPRLMLRALRVPDDARPHVACPAKAGGAAF